MRYIHIYITLIFLALVGCVKDGSINTEYGVTKLSIGLLSHSTTTKSGNGSTFVEDYSIERLRIFAFDESGTIDKMEYMEFALPRTTAFNHTIDVTKANKKFIYVLVNEPTELAAQLNNIRSVSSLKALNYNISGSLNKRLLSGESIESVNMLIPMSASKEINASMSSNIVINLDRAVARLDFYVDKDEKAHLDKVEFTSSTTITVNGLNYTASLIPNSTLSAPASTNSVSSEVANKVEVNLESSNRGTAVKLFSLFMAERSYDATDLDNNITIKIDNITLNGEVTDISSNIVLGKNVTPSLSEINRNYLYKIFATYKGADKVVTVKDEYIIEEWKELEIEGDIEGVMLAVTDAVALDWYIENNNFTVSDISFGSNKPINIYIPKLDAVSGSDYTFVKCNFLANAGSTYDLMSLNDYGIPDDLNYLLTIPWLTEAKITFTSPQTGYLTIKFKLRDASNSINSYPIQFTSGNIRKEMKIIYDNSTTNP